MANYSNILLALDLNGDFSAVVDKAATFAKTQSAALHILNVVEYLPIDPTAELAVTPPLILEEELLNVAEERIKACVNALRTDDSTAAEISYSVAAGNIRDLIVQTAKDANHDLIIVGRQQRHGLALLLGKTDDAVLHHASCDVLAITL